MSAAKKTVSVCICTHNRAGSLAKVLHALNALPAPSAFELEVIVVDNCSNDATSALVNRYVEEQPSRFRYVREGTIGLSHARNRGLREAQGEIIAYLDDDAVPREGWLEALLQGYATGADVAVVGGQILLAFESQTLPRWFAKDLYFCFSERELPAGEIVECHRIADYPYGANISFRRDLAVRHGGFDPALGRTGQALLASEESELCDKLHAGGYRVLMHPDAVVDHYIAETRITLGYLRRQAWAEGRSTLWYVRTTPSQGLWASLRGLSWRAARLLGKIALQPEERSGIVRSAYVLIAEASITYHRWRYRAGALSAVDTHRLQRDKRGDGS